MSQFPRDNVDYDSFRKSKDKKLVEQEIRTKQAFKDASDINKILARAQKGDTISHLAKYGAVYGDFTDVDDLLTAHEKLARGTEIFNDLPSEVRREFGQDPAEFFRFVNDPANADRLADVLPDLAKPGTQMPTPVRSTASEAAQAAAAAPVSAEPPAAGEAPPEAPDASS